jgi:Tol biopolymer transport system component
MRSFVVVLVSIGVVASGGASAARADPTQQFAIESVAVDGSGALRLAASPWPLASPAFSPDGRTVAFVDDAARVRLEAADGGGEPVAGEIAAGAFSTVDAVFAPVWSPDGRTLLVPALGYQGPDPRNANTSLYRVDASTGSVSALHLGRYVSYSRDGRYLAYQTQVPSQQGGGSAVGVCRPDATHDTPFGRGSYAAWAPTSDRIAYVTRRGYLTAANATGARRWTLRSMLAGPIAWLPSGRSIVFAHGGPRPALFLVSPGARTARRLVDLPALTGEGPLSVSVSADGRWIATSNDSLTVVVRSNGTYLQAIRAGSAVWAPKTATLALVAGNALWLWTPKNGIQGLYAAGQRVAEPAWSPDGTRLLVVETG